MKLLQNNIIRNYSSSYIYTNIYNLSINSITNQLYKL